MPELVEVHCRYCNQTFFTGKEAAEAQQCDLCKKEGGLMSPEAAAEEKRELERQQTQARARQEQKFGVRGWLAFVFTMLIVMGSVSQLRRPAPVGSSGWYYDAASIVVGIIGSVVVLCWPKKPAAAEKREGGNASPPTSQ